MDKRTSRKQPGVLRQTVQRLPRLMTLLAAIAVPLSALGANTDWQPSSTTKANVETAMGLIDRLEAAIPKPIDDLDDRVFELGFDEAAISSYVHRQIAYQPYVGVLRGPDGTAAVGAGNAWDQALLLAAMLKTNGVEAQIVRGVLSSEDADRLLAESFAAPLPRKEDEIDQQAIEQSMAAAGSAFATAYRRDQQSSQEKAASQPLEDTSEELASALTELLGPAKQGDLADQDTGQLRQAIAEDYVWVRWRLGPGSDWVALHPAFGQQAAPTVTATGFVDSDVPQEHLHRVAVQLFIERGQASSPDTTEQVPVMSRWERPTANLYKNQVLLAMVPQQADASPESAMLVPSLNGALAPGGQAVNRLGLTAPPGEAASQAGRYFSTVSNRGAKAAGALGGLGSDQPTEVQRLLGVVLKVESISPTGSQTVVRRVADLRNSDEDYFPLSGSFQINLDVHIGPESERQRYHDSLALYASLIPAVPAMMAFAQGELSIQQLQRTRAYKELPTATWVDFELAEAGLALPRSDNRVAFRPGALLAARRTFTLPSGELRGVTDILANPSGVLSRSSEGEIQLDRRATVKQGVRETLIESLLAGASPGWAARIPSTVVSDAQALEAEPFRDWPRQALEQARDDLANGYVLAVASDSPHHWWRVDPSSGQTLGMSAQGGSEILEYMITLTGIAISVAMFRASVKSCDEQYADNQAMADCCIVGNLIGTYATTVATGIGGALSAATGAVESTLSTLKWTLGDITAGDAIGNLDIVGRSCRAYLDQ